MSITRIALIMAVFVQFVYAAETENQPGVWNTIKTSLNQTIPNTQCSYATAIAGTLGTIGVGGACIYDGYKPQKWIPPMILLAETGSAFFTYLSDEIDEKAKDEIYLFSFIMNVSFWGQMFMGFEPAIVPRGVECLY